LLITLRNWSLSHWCRFTHGQFKSFWKSHISYNELWACEYKCTDNLQVIETSSILSVASLQPLPPLPGEPDDRWFVIHKSGLDDAQLTGYEEPMDDGIAGNVGGDDADSGDFM
jgi:hypothetical protein